MHLHHVKLIQQADGENVSMGMLKCHTSSLALPGQVCPAQRVPTQSR